LEQTRHAEEIKLKAQRKAGGLLGKLEKHRGGDRRPTSQDEKLLSPYRKAIEEAEIDKNAASRWQQLAAVPEKRFREYLAVSGAEITTSGLLKEWKREREQTLRQQARESIAQQSLEFPKGPYRVIVIDPPWRYDSREGRGPYPDMDIDEIQALPVAALAHAHCVLWLWTTNAFVREAFACLEAWGFEQKTILTWIKDRAGTGHWLRGKTEHCILAVRGRPLVGLTDQTTALIGSWNG
jgi:MT-A70